MSVVASVPSDDLAEAVRSSRSWRGVLRALGLPERSSRLGRLLRARCDQLSIDYTHFRGQRLWTDADLRRAVTAARSWSELLSLLGYAPDTGSARVTVRSHCARLGLELEHMVTDEECSPAVRAAPGVRPENLRTAGAMIVAALLCLEGYRISWPLEPSPYDLVVEKGDRPFSRVQIKTTTTKKAGGWVCGISRSTYVRDERGSRRKLYGVDEIDYFGIVDGDLSVYLLPSAVVGGRSSITLRKYRRYLIGGWPMPSREPAHLQVSAS